MGKDNDETAGGFGSVFRDRLTYLMSRIARYFRTTPNFLLGFDEAADDADAQRAGESDVYSSLGLSQEAIDGLHRLHAQAVTDPKAAELQRLLDKLICSYAHEADKLL